MSKKIEIVVGGTYGDLTITAEIDPYLSPKGSNQRRVSYVCSCGVEGAALLGNIRSGTTKSCGCLRGGNATKHGKSGTKLYKVYIGMITRCTNIKHQGYVDYGGRGIKVCNEWLENFEAFDMWAISNGYEEGLSIERVDVNGDYTASNCTWIPFSEQGLNKRMFKTNTSGITGVSYIAGQGIWRAQWKVGGKRKSRAFNVKKYGDEGAKQMAIAKRLEMEKELGITNNAPK